MSQKNILAAYGCLIVVAVGVAIGALISQWVPPWYVITVAAVVVFGSFISAAVVSSRGGAS